MNPLERVLDTLTVTQGPNERGEYLAFCPAHDDRKTPNLRVGAAEDSRVLLRCFAGCDQERILFALEARGIGPSDLFADRDRGTATRRSCTLQGYAEAKRLPASFLKDLGLAEISYSGAPALRIPYFGQDGQEKAVRFRLALLKGPERDGRFRWRSGSKALPYGLWRLDRAREAGHVILVEGESDCHTLWYHGLQALGIPGASTWKEEWSSHLDRVEKVYAVIEPDGGGEAFESRLTSSHLKDRLHLVRLEGHKDVSDLHLADPERFGEHLRTALDRAKRWEDEVRSDEESRFQRAREICEDLTRKPRILDAFADTLRNSGVAGESRVAKLLFLALTSRLLQRPVSVAVKGPSSGGKSYLTENVLRFFPDGAYHALTAMSERTLAYSEEPIKHRFLVFFEADGMASDFATYLMRSLLSEGRVRYETVESTKDGLRPRLIEREGPTGLIVTTTAVKLHPENETRLLSLTVADTREQTREVLAAIAREDPQSTDLAPWHALQEWLASPQAERRVTIPYARTLAELVPPVAVRLRRDFGAVLALIRAHTILHQGTRERDEQGRLISTLDDYEAVRELVEDLVSEGIDATISKTIKETVTAVSRLHEDADGEPVSLTAVATELGLDKSAASRRVRRATEQGHLKNLEDRRGKPARLVPGDPLPDDLRILPATEDLQALHRCITDEPETPSAPQPQTPTNENGTAEPATPRNTGDRCTVARENEGRDTPLPPSEGEREGGGDLYPPEHGATLQHPDEDGRVRFTV